MKPQNKRAAPDRATRDTTTNEANDSALPAGAQADVTPFAIADSIGNAQAAVQRAVHALIADGVTPTLRAHLVAAERALDLAQWATDYLLAEREASC